MTSTKLSKSILFGIISISMFFVTSACSKDSSVSASMGAIPSVSVTCGGEACIK
jgi:hypothetical protein